MKKEIFISLGILIVLIFSLINVEAIENPLEEKIEDLEENKNKFENFKENITSEQFLKEEWGKLFKKTKTVGPIISFFEKAAPVINPVVKYTIGKEPSLSYLFILMCFIWFGTLIFLLQGMDLASLFSGKTQWIISIGITVILGTLGIVETFANGIITILNTLGIWWVKILVATCAIILFAFSQKISKTLANYLKKKKQERKEEEERMQLETGAKVAKEFTEAVAKD
jgi:hypothetical protein